MKYRYAEVAIPTEQGKYKAEFLINGNGRFEIEWLDESTPLTPCVWVKVEDGKPTEADGQVLVTNGNGLYEIVWRCDTFDEENGEYEYRKPFAYDRHDLPMFKDGDFTHWMPLPTKPNL